MATKPKCNDKRFTIKDLIRFLREAVMFSPIPEGKKDDVYCKRFASFVMLENKSKLRLENFGVNLFKAAQKESYFQRNSKRKFPALIVNEVGGFDELKKGSQYECFTLQIGVLDKLIEDCKPNCGYCGNRDKFEIQCDVKDLLNQMWKYLQSICMACGFKYKRDDDGVIIDKIYTSNEFSWVSDPVIKHLIADGTIDGVDKNYVLTNKLQKMFREMNRRYNADNWFYPPSYHGKWFTFTFCQTLDCPELDWNVGDYKKQIITTCC